MSDDHPTCSPAEGCALCGDVAIPARVVAMDAGTGMAAAEPLDPVGPGTGAMPAALTVALDLVDGVAVGDVVLVHQGFAIERVTGP